jgi:hypothetical protein
MIAVARGQRLQTHTIGCCNGAESSEFFAQFQRFQVFLYFPPRFFLQVISQVARWRDARIPGRNRHHSVRREFQITLQAFNCKAFMAIMQQRFG